MNHNAIGNGYKDRDDFYKKIIMFANFSEASITNPSFLFQDVHDSHWDKDALNHTVEKHIHAFFSKITER